MVFCVLGAGLQSCGGLIRVHSHICNRSVVRVQGARGLVCLIVELVCVTERVEGAAKQEKWLRLALQGGEGDMVQYVCPVSGRRGVVVMFERRMTRRVRGSE